jgi:UDP-N-acetylmuramoylalanine--D-glutamate ligase
LFPEAVAGRAAAPLAAQLRDATALVDRIDRDTVRLSLLLQGLGAKVVVVGGDAPEELRASIEAAERAGITVRTGVDLNTTAVPHDVLFVHDYTSPLEPFVARELAQGRPVVHWADLLLELSRALSIGVTGSAGKSTTARLIAEMLRRAGRPTYIPEHHGLVGSANPNWEMIDVLDRLSEDAVLVMELTSSHLEYMTRSPAIAVITTITPDHVEWHGSVDRYFAAKARILDNQTPGDLAVLNRDETETFSALEARAQGRLAEFGTAPIRGHGAFLEDGLVWLTCDGAPLALAEVGELLLPRAYLGNALAAATAAAAAGAPAGAIREVLKTFDGLPGRRKLVASHAGVSVYDDGIAITPRKALASLDGFDEQTVLLLCGGEDEVAGWSMAPMHKSPEEAVMFAQFAAEVAAKARHIFVFGPGASRLVEALRAAGVADERITASSSWAQATRLAIDYAQAGDNVLLAPVFDVGLEGLAAFATFATDELARKDA